MLETALFSLFSARENNEGVGSIHIVSWFKLAACLHGNW